MNFFNYQHDDEIRHDEYTQYTYEEAYKFFEAIEQKQTK